MAIKDTFEKKAFKQYKKGNYEDAIYWFTRAIAEKPDEADLYSERGVAYFHVGKLHESLGDMDQAQHLEPRRPYRYSSRAYIKDALGDTEGAIEDYRKAIELDPEDAVAHNNLGLLEEKLGHTARAKSLYEFADAIAADQGMNKDAEKPKNIQREIDSHKAQSSMIKEMVKVFSSRKSFGEFLTFIRKGFK